MKQDITTVLGNKYCMFFHPGLPLDKFTPVQPLKKCVDTVNWLIEQHGRKLSSLDQMFHNTFGQLMRANWIYHNLATDPIRKPILVHQEHSKFIVDCGDTRIMAVSSLKNPPTLSAIITVKVDQSDQYRDWIKIENNLDLANLLNFDYENLTLLFNVADPGLDWCITWLEIGDPSTSHHLHDVYQRVAMLEHWLGAQPNNFKFSTDWIKEPIDWKKFSSTDPNP